MKYLGLELLGAKNNKTSLSVLEYYPKEKKIFLLDVYEGVSSDRTEAPDESLLSLLKEITEESDTPVGKIGVQVPLSLPPCVECVRKSCPLPERCTVPSVKFMREIAGATKGGEQAIYPYSQRPVEVWSRHRLLSELREKFQIDVDDALGGSKAALTARMHFLKRHLKEFQLIEAWPKFSVLMLALDAECETRAIQEYRSLEDGIHLREELLLQISERNGIFVYERDLRKLTHSLAAFDSFFIALTALFCDANRVLKPPKGFPSGAQWVSIPDLA